MCLDRLEKFPIRQTKKGEAWVWKVFCADGRNLRSLFCGSGGPIPRGEWLGEKSVRRMDSTRNRRLFTEHNPCRIYPYGFHYYLKEADARVECESWCGGKVVKKVRVRNIVAMGIQHNARVLVAKEMYVPKRGQRRPPSIGD